MAGEQEPDSHYTFLGILCTGNKNHPLAAVYEWRDSPGDAMQLHTTFMILIYSGKAICPTKQWQVSYWNLPLNNTRMVVYCLPLASKLVLWV